jgi:hypothetical protein
MRLSLLTGQYVAFKQSMGMRFQTEARTLQAVGYSGIGSLAAILSSSSSAASSSRWSEHKYSSTSASVPIGNSVLFEKMASIRC